MTLTVQMLNLWHYFSKNSTTTAIFKLFYSNLVGFFSLFCFTISTNKTRWFRKSGYNLARLDYLWDFHFFTLFFLPLVKKYFVFDRGRTQTNYDLRFFSMSFGKLFLSNFLFCEWKIYGKMLNFPLILVDFSREAHNHKSKEVDRFDGIEISSNTTKSFL